MDLFAHINSLGICMEELSMISDTWFYSTEDRMDQYQSGFRSQYEQLFTQIAHIFARQDQIESCLEH